MGGLTTAIILISIVVGVILAVYFGRRYQAKKILLIASPTVKKSIKWKTSQRNELVCYIVASLNELQEIEDDILYFQETISWNNNRIKAWKILRKKDEVEKEKASVNTINDKIVKLKNDRLSILSKFENIVPKTKGSTISMPADFTFFSAATGDIVATLLRNPKFCKMANGCRILLCADFYVAQNGNCVTIEPYYNMKAKETYELQRLGYSRACARDDEVYAIRYMHERKKGGPDRRYSYNPSAYVVYRGIGQLSFNGLEGTPVKFSNRVKAHAWVTSLNGLTIRAATIINKNIYAKMISLGELHSVPEVLKIIESEEKAQSIQIQSQPKKQDNYDKTQGAASYNDKGAEDGSEMKNQPAWNRYEAALLLDGYLQISFGENRKEVIEKISNMLRQMAIASGIKIDSIYRNVNGITLQMDRMRMAMTGQIDEGRKPNKVFLDIVSLYKNDRENYSQILAKAKAMCKETSREAEDLTVEIELPPPIETEDSEDQVKTQKNSEDVIKIYDYKSDTVLRFTKPVLVVYFGEIDSQVQSWRDAYVSVFRSLLSDYPTKIKELAEKPEFTTVSFDSQNLRRAIEVSPSLYIEGNRSASEIGRAIGQLLDICNVDYDNVVIRYTSIDAENTPSLSEIVSSRKTVEKGVVADEETIDISELDNEIYKVIKTKYLNGFLVGAINFKKVRRFYAEIYAKELEIENEAIEESLKKTCVLLDNKYYAIDSLVQDELKFKIAEFIQQGIDCKGYVYYQMIIDNFGYELTDRIPDMKLLKEFLRKSFSQYAYFDEYLARDKDVKIDIAKEVEDVLLEAVYPISFDKICSKLPHLTEEAVRKAVLFDDKIIVTNNNDRFNIDAMGLTDEDIKGIAGIIRGVLKEHNCMFGNELLKGIQSQLPTLYEGIKEFGDRGIRGAIAYKLKEQFRFNSNIICDIGANIDNAEVFKSFAEEERYFSLSALVNLKEQIGVGGVYFDSVNEVASRINANDYVPNGALLFNEDAIDELLERIIIGNQASIKEASNFAIYPSTCQPWTEYLLESYVAKFSKKFKLIHICYAESKCSGAIVKRSSEINSMDDVVVEYLVTHKDIQTANDALNGLVEDGYIARKRYKNIEDLLVVAKAKGRA